MDVRSYDRILSMSPEERKSVFNTKIMLKHEENVNKKIKTVTEVRDLKKMGFSNREISRRTGLTTTTIRKYLDENFTPIHASYGKKRNGKLIPYIKKIDDCLEQGMMGSVIEKIIRESGYEGSSSTIRHYITDWKRRRKQDYDKTSIISKKTEIVERKDILKLLYHPIDKVKTMSQNRIRPQYWLCRKWKEKISKNMELLKAIKDYPRVYLT